MFPIVTICWGNTASVRFSGFMFPDCQYHCCFHKAISEQHSLCITILNMNISLNMFQEYLVSEYCFLVMVWIAEWSISGGFAKAFTKYELETTSSGYTLWQHSDVRFLKIHGIQECWVYNIYFHLTKPSGNSLKKLSLSNLLFTKILHILFFPLDNSIS